MNSFALNSFEHKENGPHVSELVYVGATIAPKKASEEAIHPHNFVAILNYEQARARELRG